MVELGDEAVDEFLQSQPKRGTANTYRTQMRHYLEFAGKSGRELLSERKADKDFKFENSMFQFRKWHLEKGKSENTAKIAVGCVRAFYSYYRMPLVFRRQESKKLTEQNRTTADYFFDKEDFTKMALAGSLKERYVLLVGKSMGMRGGDFAALSFGQFRCLKLDNEPPIAFGEIGTGKEKVKAYLFLDSDAVPIVKTWLEGHRDAKDTDRMIDDTESNLSIILQSLCEKAGMEIKNGSIHGKRVRFHCLRKFLIDRLSAYASESQWKQIVGKAIGEGAYVSQEQLRGVFARAMKDLVINGNGVKVKKLIELENALVDSQKRLTNMETTNEALRRELVTLTDKVNVLNGALNIMDESDLKIVSEFFQKLHLEKEASAQIEAEKSELELRERVTKKMKIKKPEGFKEELDNYRRDGYDR